jgi:hypothetical protein
LKTVLQQQKPVNEDKNLAAMIYLPVYSPLALV